MRIVNTNFYVVMDRKIASIKEIKKQILSSSVGMDRFQSTLVFHLGKFYLKRLHGDHLRDEIAKAFVEEDRTIKSERDLINYVQEIGVP